MRTSERVGISGANREVGVGRPMGITLESMEDATLMRPPSQPDEATGGTRLVREAGGGTWSWGNEGLMGWTG